MTVPATMLGGSATARPGARAAGRTTPRATQSQGSALVRDRWRMSTEALALVMVTATLVAFGLATLYSASAFYAMSKDHPSWFYLWRQFTGIVFGVVGFAFLAKFDTERFREWAWPIMGLSILALLVTVLPGMPRAISPVIGGSRRFLLGGSIQPSEFAKLALVIWTAMLIVKKGGEEGLRRLSKGLMPFMIILGVLSLIVALQPDLSVVLFYALVMGIMLFAAGARIGHFVLLGIAAVPVLWSEVHRLEYVMRRIMGFAAGADTASAVNHQLQQSLIAVGSGGIFGVGFGQGRQQLGFLPLPYNDFVGSNVGEEWGFIGMAGLILLYSAWGWLGFRIARMARTPFQQLTAIGLTVTMVITAFLHLGVVIGLLPTTGLTLPFISYGRSNILLSLLMTGILVNIGSQKERVIGEQATNPLA
ncbi:MAG: putative lipid II flippase FtsW [Gemmatimonadetes bacterium]|nr:putative lipid II flippase FtsW [Gemmatimonadota bacterium]